MLRRSESVAPDTPGEYGSAAPPKRASEERGARRHGEPSGRLAVTARPTRRKPDSPTPRIRVTRAYHASRARPIAGTVAFTRHLKQGSGVDAEWFGGHMRFGCRVGGHRGRSGQRVLVTG